VGIVTIGTGLRLYISVHRFEVTVVGIMASGTQIQLRIGQLPIVRIVAHETSFVEHHRMLMCGLGLDPDGLVAAKTERRRFGGQERALIRMMTHVTPFTRLQCLGIGGVHFLGRALGQNVTVTIQTNVPGGKVEVGSERRPVGVVAGNTLAVGVWRMGVIAGFVWSIMAFNTEVKRLSREQSVVVGDMGAMAGQATVVLVDRVVSFILVEPVGQVMAGDAHIKDRGREFSFVAESVKFVARVAVAFGERFVLKLAAKPGDEIGVAVQAGLRILSTGSGGDEQDNHGQIGREVNQSVPGRHQTSTICRHIDHI
jgi:hypothetical protein